MTGLSVLISSAIADCGMRDDCHLSGAVINSTRHRDIESASPACQVAAQDREAAQHGLTQVCGQCKLLEDAMRRTTLLERFTGGTSNNVEANTFGQHVALDRMRFFAKSFDKHERSGELLVLIHGAGTGKCCPSAAVMKAIVPKNVMLQELFA